MMNKIFLNLKQIRVNTTQLLKGHHNILKILNSRTICVKHSKFSSLYIYFLRGNEEVLTREIKSQVHTEST